MEFKEINPNYTEDLRKAMLDELNKKTIFQLLSLEDTVRLIYEGAEIEELNKEHSPNEKASEIKKILENYLNSANASMLEQIKNKI